MAALTAFDGPIQEFIKDNPNIYGMGVSFLIIFLRILTNTGVKLK